jgi:hypothetical protein
MKDKTRTKQRQRQKKKMDKAKKGARQEMVKRHHPRLPTLRRTPPQSTIALTRRAVSLTEKLDRKVLLKGF